VIELARVASSGDQVLRGGQNHEGAEFTVRSCFLFSSILLPPMLAQDRNRLAILELDPIPEGQVTRRRSTWPSCAISAARIRRRLVDHWHRLDELVERYKAALGAKGHGGRSGDQFGTLLAVADLMLYDVADDATIDSNGPSKLKADTLAEKATELADEQECVRHLATLVPSRSAAATSRSRSSAISATRSTEGTTRRATGSRISGCGSSRATWKVDDDGNPEVGAHKPRGVTPQDDLYLAIANNHVGLARVFAETRWSQRHLGAEPRPRAGQGQERRGRRAQGDPPGQGALRRRARRLGDFNSAAGDT
jgi:hypothetical protein